MSDQPIIKDVDTFGLRPFEVNSKGDEAHYVEQARRALADLLERVQAEAIAEPDIRFRVDHIRDEKFCYASVRAVAMHDHIWQVVDPGEPLGCSICGKQRWPREIS